MSESTGRTKLADETRAFIFNALKEDREVRGLALLEAFKVINGERQSQYGKPEDSFGIISEFWSILFGIPVSREQAQLAMVLFKVARQMRGTGKHDNFVDAMGYLAMADDEFLSKQ